MIGLLALLAVAGMQDAAFPKPFDRVDGWDIVE